MTTSEQTAPTGTDGARDLEAFRQEVRSWFAEHTPAGWEEHLRTADEDESVRFFREWARSLHAGGYLVPHWPVERGGAALPLAEQIVIQQEMSRIGAPRPRYQVIALGHAAATLLEHGTPEQQRLLDGVLDGDIWCQGFSEPEAGSDLASLRTRAVREGDHYVINGQKTWSSMAYRARWCLLLARTDAQAPKHRGISVFILDMHAPGLDIRPIKQATGSAEFCELFLSDVRVPASMLVGAENDGWRIAQTTLTTERASQLLELHQGLETSIRRLAEQARHQRGSRGEPRTEDSAFRQELARHAADVDAFGLLVEKIMQRLITDGHLGPESSIGKLYFSELLQRLMRFGVQLNAMNAQVNHHNRADLSYTSGDWMIDYIRSWTWTIAAGSNEIQRNIIAEKVLGLPREPRTVQ
jgi:alkylation response protein AidB-like acyl-CoA dehydrogenase